MPKISIIIPVYNTGKYIEKCLDSVKKQTMKDLEIIVVNDGSTDNSEDVINNWIKDNPDIVTKYYKKENGGLSSARNYGIEKANGKYIMLLDSDDYIDSKLFENLEQYINNEIDLIKFKMTTVDESGKQIAKLSGPVFEKCTGEEAFEKLAGNDNFLEVACIYLYRREFFVENNFSYNTKNKYHEDFGLTPLIIINAKTVVSTEVYGYYYMQTENSIMRNEDYSKNIQKANDVLAHYDNMLDRIDGYYISDSIKDLIKRYYTNTVILKTKELKGNDRKEYLKQIKLRKVYKNIKPINFKQRVKRNILRFNINLYLKMR